MKTLTTIAITAICTAVALTVFNAQDTIGASWAAWGRSLDAGLSEAALCVRVLFWLAVAVGVVGFLVWVRRQEWKMSRPQDGSFGIREYWLEPLPRRVLNWFTGRPSVRVIVNPNNEVGAVRILGPFGTMEPEPAAGWPSVLTMRQLVQTTHHLQASTPGDDVLGGLFGHKLKGRTAGIPNAATAKLLAGAYNKPQRQIESTEAEPEPEADQPAWQPAKFGAVFNNATPTEWILGQNQTSQACFFPVMQHNVGIVGAQGTGKTACSGFHVLALALRFGYHPIILDPKGGVDFRQWQTHAEWHPTDASVFGDQVAALLFEHRRRQAIIEDYRAPNIDALPAGVASGHVMVFVEEFGALWEELEATLKRPALKEVAGNLDTLMRLSRATGIHWCVIDQFPDKWSDQVLMAIKCRLVYKVAPGQDSYLREWGADAIADRGEFMHRRAVFNAWHVAPKVPKLLAALPPTSQPHIIGSASSVSEWEGGAPEVEVTEPPTEPAPNEPTERKADKRQMVFEWRRANPEGTQLEFRAWAFNQGVHVAKGYTSDMFKAFDMAQSTDADRLDLSTEAGRAAFAALAIDARLPGGDKLGTDISKGA